MALLRHPLVEVTGAVAPVKSRVTEVIAMIVTLWLQPEPTISVIAKIGSGTAENGPSHVSGDTPFEKNL